MNKRTLKRLKKVAQNYINKHKPSFTRVIYLEIAVWDEAQTRMVCFRPCPTISPRYFRPTLRVMAPAPHWPMGVPGEPAFG